MEKDIKEKDEEWKTIEGLPESGLTQTVTDDEELNAVGTENSSRMKEVQN